MTPAELTTERELEAKAFAAEKLEDPDRAVRIWGDYTWSDDDPDLRQARVEGFARTLESLGLTEIDASMIKESAVLESGGKVPESGRIEVARVFEQIADSVGGIADNPNDFTIVLRLPYSEAVDVVIQYQMEEAGVICRECSEPGADANVLPGESCEHHRDDFDIRIEQHVLFVRTDHRLNPGCYGRFA
jgi:hypothetical protein